MKEMVCRLNCGACCIAISISSPLPGMPNGKKAGERCIHLGKDNLCKIHNESFYPDVCRRFLPELSFCGNNREEALKIISEIEMCCDSLERDLNILQS